MTYISDLVCRECGTSYPQEPLFVCRECFGPLEVEYDYQRIGTQVDRSAVEAGPLNLWRYQALLPLEREPVTGADVGFTPLVKVDRLGEALGLKQLYVKNDSVNPSFSFKDRVVAVAASKAVEFGFDTLACASTGNLANAVASQAARAGLDAYVFIPDDLEESKVVASGVYGPQVVAVDGTYDDVNRLCSMLADEYRWAFVNVNIRPYYAEGAKTLAFEVAEQLDWQAPDHVVVPMASGNLLVKIRQGFSELHQVGWIDEPRTHVSGAQAEGCAPIVTAFKAGDDWTQAVKPQTVAKSLAIGNPGDGHYAIQAMRQSGGFAESVTDDEIVEGIKLLARTEGIFTETAGGVTVGVLKKLAENGRIGANEVTVAYITGNGLKTQSALDGRLNLVTQIQPTLRSFVERLPQAGELAPSLTVS